jgi:hypothetical protein
MCTFLKTEEKIKNSKERGKFLSPACETEIIYRERTKTCSKTIPARRIGKPGNTKPPINRGVKYQSILLNISTNVLF